MRGSARTAYSIVRLAALAAPGAGLPAIAATCAALLVELLGAALTEACGIDSNPDTARWYRRPRYVVTGAATHRMEHSERPSGRFNG